MSQGNDLFAVRPTSSVKGPTTILVLGRASDNYTVDFQSQMDFLSAGGDKVILVEDGAAAVDAIISGRLLDNTGNTGAWSRRARAPSSLPALPVTMKSRQDRIRHRDSHGFVRLRH